MRELVPDRRHTCEMRGRNVAATFVINTDVFCGVGRCAGLDCTLLDSHYAISNQHLPATPAAQATAECQSLKASGRVVRE
jgi:hypothetical protein